MTAFDPASNPTLSSGYNDVTLAAWVSPNILNEERPLNVSRPHWREEGPHESIAVDFPIQADPGASAAYTEGTGMANTALTTDKATASALTYGLMATVTDEVQETAVLDVHGQVTQVLARGGAEEFETLACTYYDDFSNTSGTAGTPVSYATLLDATNKLAQRDQTGNMVGIIDPVNAGSVRADLGTSGAAALANPNGPIGSGDVLMEHLAGSLNWNGLAGADWYQTSLVTTGGGGVFIQGVALGLYMIRDVRIETIRVPQLPGLAIVQTQRHGMIEIRDRAGQTILY